MVKPRAAGGRGREKERYRQRQRERERRGGIDKEQVSFFINLYIITKLETI